MLRLAGAIEESIVDGMGVRTVLFTQGCKHGCKGCHNIDTWSMEGGEVYDIDDLYMYIISNALTKGVTISGGEPMLQAKELVPLVRKLKETTDKDVWVYTGYTYEECLEDSNKREFLKYVDVLVDGKFVQEQKSSTLNFRGSKNQRLIDVQKTLQSDTVELLNI